MSRTPKPIRTRLHARIAPQTRKRLKEHCAARGISSRAGVEEAIARYLDDVSDPGLIMKRLDRLGRAVARVQRDNELFMESFTVFVKLWFAHTPSVGEADKPAAQVNAEARYRQFVKYVSDLLARGHRAFDDFPRESIADPPELTAIGVPDSSAARVSVKSRPESG